MAAQGITKLDVTNRLFEYNQSENLSNKQCIRICKSRNMLLPSRDSATSDTPLCFLSGANSGGPSDNCNQRRSLQKNLFIPRFVRNSFTIKKSGRLTLFRNPNQKIEPVVSNAISTAPLTTIPSTFVDEQDYLKAGGAELDLVRLQASKPMDQPTITSQLKQLVPEEGVLDLIVIGCGPAGLALAAEAGKQGLSVGLIGPDAPFVNNYGVWFDEFRDIGLAHCIEHCWRDTAVYLDNKPVMIGRAYGRVSRDLLRNELLERCAAAGVLYMATEVDNISDTSATGSTVSCANGSSVSCRLVTVAAGAAAGKFLTYEGDSRGVGVQTAYGIEVEVESYPYDPTVMHFMDYRDIEKTPKPHPSEGPFEKIPSFLYAMPITPTRVFFEETCLAARPAMPFEMLKQRLERRLQTLGITYSQVYEEEWSYIPVGGTLPHANQQHIGFGAAASMIHPATGYSIARSLTEAPHYAATIAAALQGGDQNISKLSSEWTSRAAALQAWDCLWSRERRRQRSFMLFGLELILRLDLQGTRSFFRTFFLLPEWLWRGFLGSSLSSAHLLWFALNTFALAPNELRFLLIKHLLTDPSGSSLVLTYAGLDTKSSEQKNTLPVVDSNSSLLPER